jgi:ATP-dependent DNA helicase RecQ
VTKHEILKNTFGYSSFRCGQEEVIDSVLAGRDVLAVMPTGAGKSLCYQIPALLLPGMTVVISPLISLMKDQVNALKEAGCPAAFLNSSLSAIEYNQTMDEILRGDIKLLYIAPERLQKADMSIFTDTEVPLVVIDEAHCVSQWGHDFRTSYLQIADFIRLFEKRPVTAAFTATATVKVKDDIANHLDLENPFFINTGFDRPNLYFEIQKPKDKKLSLLECLEKRKNSSGIVYCATRKSVEEVCALLHTRGFPATRYHAGLEDSERRKNQDDFLYDRKTVMVATNALGMGIDKSNVSYVIHYNMPKNIESYYQEAGRAGRDGAPADCILLYSGQDVQINKFLINQTDDDEAGDPGLIAHNLELLKQMTFYATSNDCLRQRLLSYFGEQPKAFCGNCSNCRTEFEEIDVTLEGRKIVSCVFRLAERSRSFGKTMIIDILRGSKNEKILRFGFDSLSTWGIMKDTNAQKIRAILDHLIDEGILLLEEGEYPVVTMGRAAELLKEERRLVMKLPKEKKKSEALLVKSDSGKSGFSKTLELPIDVDEALLEKLKKLRREIALEEGVPAYIVFSDATLRDMCRKKPASLIQFSAINGVGQVKLEKYGEVFTELIQKHINAN